MGGGPSPQDPDDGDDGEGRSHEPHERGAHQHLCAVASDYSHCFCHADHLVILKVVRAVERVVLSRAASMLLYRGAQVCRRIEDILHAPACPNLANVVYPVVVQPRVGSCWL